jgi:hypothetical protein
MLLIGTLAVMGIIGYIYFREGLFTAAVMMVNVFLAGLLTFNFFEPLADSMGTAFRRTFLQGYEDFLAMIGLFCLFLGVLRGLTNNLNDTLIEYPMVPQQFGALACGVIAGYLLSGFLVCSMQTLPWSEGFLGFEPRQQDEAFVRRLLPPDRVWLALMQRASTHTFSRADDESHAFDRFGAFESNYRRLRRTAD